MAINAQAGPADGLAVEGSRVQPGTAVYTWRRGRMVDYLSFGATLPEARGVFIDTGELRRLWQGPRRIFLVARRPRGQSVVVALPPVEVYDLGQYGSRWLYSNRRP